jgi:Zn-dependent protease
MFFGFSLTDLIVLIGSILVAMSVHEAVHAYVGLRLGDDTAAEQGRVSLNPLKHIDPVTTVALPVITLVLFHAPILAARPVPFNPHRVKFDEFGAALIAIAGPVSNLLLAVAAAVLVRLLGANSFLVDALILFITLNVGLFIFNLVPIPPLDGSRVLYAFAPEPVQQLLREVEPYGLFLIFALVLLGGFGGVLVTLNSFVLRLLLA